MLPPPPPGRYLALIIENWYPHIYIRSDRKLVQYLKGKSGIPLLVPDIHINIRYLTQMENLYEKCRKLVQYSMGK